MQAEAAPAADISESLTAPLIDSQKTPEQTVEAVFNAWRIACQGVGLFVTNGEVEDVFKDSGVKLTDALRQTLSNKTTFPYVDPADLMPYVRASTDLGHLIRFLRFSEIVGYNR
mmetsp:Transcript_2488/g.8868  ORF Transcript_2488/g.8868 Transcript_2488/m.8868 type:complete len:114 (+) Transcript_2488:1193-1534(+)